MKRTLVMLAVLVVTKAALGETVTLDGAAAYVNDTIITVGEVKEAMMPVVTDLRDRYDGAEFEAGMKQAYLDTREDLINAKLILKAYDADTKINKDGIDKYVEKRIADFIKDRFDGDRQAFLKALREEHMSMDEWRRRMRERIIVGMMKSREVDAKVVISPRDVLKEYEGNPTNHVPRVKLRVMVVHGAADAAGREAKAKTIRETLAKLKAGADFAELARTVSEDSRAAKGGEWDWTETRDLQPVLAKSVKDAAVGLIGEPIVIDGDTYLVKVEGRQAGIPFEEARRTIEKELRKRDSSRLAAIWMKQLRKDAYIRTIESTP